LCFASELCASFPAFFEETGTASLLRACLAGRRAEAAPASVLSLSFRTISAQNLHLDASHEMECLVRRHLNGGLARFCPLYNMPTPNIPVYFGSAAQTLSFAIRALSHCPPQPINPNASGNTALRRLREKMTCSTP